MESETITTTQPIPDDHTSTQPQPNVAKRKTGRPRKTEVIAKRNKVLQTARTLQNATQQEIADKAGVCRQTVSNYLDKYGTNKQEIDLFVTNRLDIVRSKQQQILDALTPAKLQNAAARDLMVGYGILLDKDRLESGQSTANIANWTNLVHKAQDNNIKDVTNT